MKRNIVAAIGVIGLGISLFVLIASNFGSDSVFNLFAKERDSLGAKNPPVVLSETAKAVNDALVNVSNAVVPTVVSISVEIEEKAGSNPMQEQWQEFFKFFGEPEDGEEEGPAPKAEASGSGVIISEDGYIVTNNHVVENASEIKVTTNDKKEHKAKLIGRDPLTDLALIKIEANGLPMIHFADMDNVKVGEMVIAVGNPLGLNSTVTSGIISAIGRGDLSLLRNKGGYSVEHFIQTDAAINPGNSGGGLFNLSGSLVGINTAIATRTGSYIGYGFAIPVDLVQAVVYDLIDDGKIDRGYIGVQIRSVDEVMAKSSGLDKVQGVVVHDVLNDSPAEKAGLEPGDIILELDGKPISTSNELQSLIVLRRAGDNVNLTVWRDGKKIYKSITLQRKDDDAQVVDNSDNSKKDKDEDASKPVTFDKIGFSVTPLTKEIKDKNKVSQGVYISKVDRYSIAESRGLQANGVIVKADGKNVSSTDDLKNILKNKKPGDAVALQVKYSDANRIVAFEIPE
ncbi:MAG: Do family serine endopeptidase [Bacteroidota bacterium]|nr:Do family serine endopeptidase [Bacteroidota bacterium]